MKIGVKITLLVVAAVVGIIVLYFISSSALTEVDEMFTYIGNTPVRNTELANNILDQVNMMAQQSAMLCFDTVEPEKRLAINGAASDAMKKYIDTLKGNVHAPEVVECLKNLEERLQKQLAIRAIFAAAVRRGDLEQAREIRRTTLAAAIDSTIATAFEMIDITTSQTYQAAFNDSDLVVQAGVRTVLIISILIAVILGVVAFFIITGITKPLKRAVEAANHVAEGDLKIDLTTTAKDETGILMRSLEQMVSSINRLITDTNTLSTAAIGGQLEVRADANKHKGAYQELIEGINKTLDAVIGPLNVTAEYVDRISKGDMPPIIAETYNGDFNEIKNNLNGCINAITLLVVEINSSINNALDGNFKYRADENKHKGDFKKIMEGVNDLVEAFVEPLEATSIFLQDAASGNADIKKMTKEYKGEFNVIKEAINKLYSVLFIILDELSKATTAAENGNLDVKTDSSKVQGSWVTIMEGLNRIIGAANAIITDAGLTLSTMATGDLTPRVTKDYPGKFGNMKDDINNLGDSLTDLISQLQTAIHTTASASAQISATAETISTATQEQSSQTDEVASAVEEMSRTVTDNAHSATKTAEVAKKSGDTANLGGKIVQQTVAKMREISSVVKASADNIAKLGESSQKIGEIIGVIDDIADQTNLLSLNAAIEAARAGEQGRGFAVVADSVGKLAISTASATKEIADMIKGIQSDTEAAVRAMEKGTSEVQSGIELADSAGNSIQNILSGINELLEMVNQIAAASEEQSATSEQISKNVASISKATTDSAHNIEDVAATANELAKMTETLTSLVSQFKVDTRGPHTPELRNTKNKYLTS